MEDQVYFSPSARKYWVSHSPLLADILEGMNFANSEVVGEEDVVSLPRNYFTVFTDSQWNLFKGLVEGDPSIFWIGPSGTPYLNANPRDLKQVLDFLLFDPKTMLKDLGSLAKSSRVLRGAPTSVRQTSQLRALATANQTRRMRAEAARVGIPLRNYLEILEEDREERKAKKKTATRRAASKFKKQGLGVNSSSALRSSKKGKMKWGEKQATVLRKRKPSRFVEEEVNENNNNN